MTTSELRPASSTSPFLGFFHAMFEAVDMTSAYWQPVMKSIGRSNLELASFAARRGQAALAWQRAVIATPGPLGAMHATEAYWKSMLDEYSTFAPRMVSAMMNRTDPVGSVDVVHLSVRKPHDRIEIPSQELESEIRYERRVA